MAVSYLDFKRFSEQSIPIQDYMVEEICLRVLVSASYYAIYHRALELSSLVRTFPINDVPGSTHKKLSDFYVKPFDIRDCFQINDDVRSKMKRVGYVLQTLHTRRVLADYKIDDTMSEVDMHAVISQSSKYIDIINDIVDSL